jgi:hypothetical protein
MAHNTVVPRPGFSGHGSFPHPGFGPGHGFFPGHGFGHAGHFGFFGPGFHGTCFSSGFFFHHHNCFGGFCGGFFFPSTFGFGFGFGGFGFGGFGAFGFWGPSLWWPPIFADYYYPPLYYAPPPPTVVAAPSPSGDPELYRRLDDLSNQVADLRAEQQAANNVPRPPTAEAQPTSTTTLIFRDGHREDVNNYAVVDGTVWVFNAERARKIPLSALDVDATRSVNESRGVEFGAPRK